jgi:hypothetical protein
MHTSGCRFASATIWWTLGMPIANTFEAEMSLTGAQAPACSGCLRAIFRAISFLIDDAGHQSHKLARTLKRNDGWQLRIVSVLSRSQG